MNATPYRPRALITSGPASEPLDSVRRITNHSTGELGALLAAELCRRGWEVECLQGMGAIVPCRPEHAKVTLFVTNDDLLAELEKRSRETEPPVVILHAAALCDFRVGSITAGDDALVRGHKIESRAGGLTLGLEPAAKVIARLRGLFPSSLIIGWKFELDGSPAQAVEKAHRQIVENAIDACVLNGRAHGPGFSMFTREATPFRVATKQELAARLATWCEDRLVRPHSTPTAESSDFDQTSMHPEHYRTAALEILDQGLGLLARLSPDDYAEQHPQAFNASIGGHYRHCLDHFECLLNREENCVDYDARQRDIRVETDSAFAAERTRQLMELIRSVPAEDLSGLVRVRCRVSTGGDESPTVDSTYAREVVYAIVHAVHHYALIGVMLQLLELKVPDGFGVAPSTLHHRNAVSGH